MHVANITHVKTLRQNASVHNVTIGKCKEAISPGYGVPYYTNDTPWPQLFGNPHLTLAHASPFRLAIAPMGIPENNTFSSEYQNASFSRQLATLP